jgi:hypothetical protein
MRRFGPFSNTPSVLPLKRAVRPVSRMRRRTPEFIPISEREFPRMPGFPAYKFLRNAAVIRCVFNA